MLARFIFDFLGRKGWVMFPPDVLPPGVYVTPDEAEVTSPLAISGIVISSCRKYVFPS